MAIEQTSKTWKILTACGTIALFAGLCWLIVLPFTEAAAKDYIAPSCLAAGGIFARMFGRVGKWWFNE